MVGQDLSGQRILDAFAGSGLLALEAWSRGAVVVAVERDGGAARRIRDNVAGLGATVEVVHGDVARVVASLGRFDGILADPPYGLDPAPALGVLAAHAQHWIVLEQAATATPPTIAGFRVERRRTYGGTALSLYDRESS